jgi:Transposase DNA-binding
VNIAEKRTESVVDEVAAAEFGDSRLNDRGRRIARRLAMRPGVSFPAALVTEAELEGFYRFVANEKVTPVAILAPHVQASVARVTEHGTVLAAHDTTEFQFGGEARKDLGEIKKAGSKLLGHFCLCLSADGHRDPLGVVAMKTWVRDGGPTPSSLRKSGVSYAAAQEVPSEYARWQEGVEAAEKAVGGKASLIHLMDSESDDFALLSFMQEKHYRFVIRSCRDRNLDATATGSLPGEKIRAFVARAQVRAVRKVELTRRKLRPIVLGMGKRDQPREARTAKLSFSATKVVIRRPWTAVETPGDSISVNVVSVKEKNPPPGMEPVDWILFTDEPIETAEDILAVADHYRGRWPIEEYFKALKSGCVFEERQLESKATIVKALALFVPIAWVLLRMRAASRSSAKASIDTVLTPTQIVILKKETGMPLRKNSSAVDAYLAVARLGGHIKNNGPPGWQVLGRGYAILLMLETGFKIGQSEACDQS